MTNKDAVLKALRAQKDEGPTAEQLEKAKVDWLAAVAELMKTIRGWLQAAIDQKLLATSTIKTELFEEQVDPYECEGIRITTPKGLRVDVKPYGRFVLGFQGRVDIVCGSKRIMVLLVGTDPPSWSIGTRPTGKLRLDDLTEESFWGLLKEILS